MENRTKILDELWSIAKLDHVVTEDERQLLKTLEEQLDHYELLDRDVRMDDLVEFGEFLALRQARKQILERALATAFADGRVTDDERQLLVRIIEVLPLVR
ncbi:MAG: TerB family tellurite resistance protein [Myxococcales bacterium]|nr:TerB family tellurite resistance protein [Myxococcales bacterium]